MTDPTLFLIPARGGSKGLPGKNIKKLHGKPLIHYCIELSREFAADNDICVSTDDKEIAQVASQLGIELPFIRPASLATDTSGTREVILHALAHYADKGIFYNKIVLLQPTSPFRRAEHLKQALDLYNSDFDMVVSVKETKSNPYFVLYEEDEQGFLKKSKDANVLRRQDVPKVWEFNGAVYIINASSIKQKAISEFTRIKKVTMDNFSSLDIDTITDWEYAEFLIDKGYIKLKK